MKETNRSVKEKLYKLKNSSKNMVNEYKLYEAKISVTEGFEHEDVRANDIQTLLAARSIREAHKKIQPYLKKMMDHPLRFGELPLLGKYRRTVHLKTIEEFDIPGFKITLERKVSSK